MKKHFLILMVLIGIGAIHSLKAKGDRKASMIGTDVHWTTSGPLSLPASPTIKLLEELEVKKSDKPTVQREVRYEIQMNNQYELEDNRHHRMPFLIEQESKPFEYDQSTNAIYLYVPTEQRGQFMIKRTTIEYIPVQVGPDNPQMEAAEHLPIISLRPGDSYKLRRPLLHGNHYYAHVNGIAQFFPGNMFTIPEDWTDTSFKVYVGKQSEKTNRVAYVVNVKQPQSHGISYRKNDPCHTPVIPQISLAPGEEFIIQTMVTKEPAGKESDTSGTEQDPRPAVSYTLKLDEYADEDIQPKIEKQVTRTPVKGEKYDEVTTQWVLIIPSHIHVKPRASFSGGIFTVQMALSHSGKDHLPQAPALSIFKVKIENNHNKGTK